MNKLEKPLKPVKKPKTAKEGGEAKHILTELRSPLTIIADAVKLLKEMAADVSPERAARAALSLVRAAATAPGLVPTTGTTSSPVAATGTA
jgi:hypothetical protein